MTFQQEHRDAVINRVDLSNPSPSPLETLEGETVFWIGHGESGRNLVLARGNWRITLRGDAEHFRQTGTPFFGLTGEVEKCEIEYRDRGSLDLIGDPIDDGDACNFGALNTPHLSAGTATIAPSVIAPRVIVSGAGAPMASMAGTMPGEPVTVSLPGQPPVRSAVASVPDSLPP